MPPERNVVPLNGRPRWSLPRGRVLLRALRDLPAQEYLVLMPSAGAADASVLVSVHGVSRNAFEQARVLAAGCEERGIVLVVPMFTAEQHKDYQRLGRRGRGVRADLLLNRCLEEVALLGSVDVTQFRLFGYSGGAQFAHRYAMAHPHRVARAVFAAAGWYTFPDHTQRFPYGIRASGSLPGVSFNPEHFLRIPIHVLVGARDVGTANLRGTKRVVSQQGRTRVERARRWAEAMREAGKAYGIDSDITLAEVPAADHSFKTFCRRGALIERVFNCLFGIGADAQGDRRPRLPDDDSSEAPSRETFDVRGA